MVLRNPRAQRAASSSRGPARTKVHAGLLAAAIGTVAPLVCLSGVAAASPGGSRQDVTVLPGQTYEVTQTTRLHRLTVEPGGSVTVPSGDSLTMTVDGVETGQKLTSTNATTTAIVPGTYRGNVVLTVDTQNLVSWQNLEFPIRQALYVDGNGVEPDQSAFANVLGGWFDNTSANHIALLSTGEAYDGVYVNNGTYTLNHPVIAFRGNGRSDFIGDGAARGQRVEYPPGGQPCVH